MIELGSKLFAENRLVFVFTYIFLLQIFIHRDINFDLVEKVPELPAPWWTTECDKSLLIGVFRHGSLLLFVIVIFPTVGPGFCQKLT